MAPMNFILLRIVLVLTFVVLIVRGQTRDWTRMLGSTGTNAEAGYGVALDTANSRVYVAGYASVSLSGETSVGGGDIALMRYGTDGTLAWTRIEGSTGYDVAWEVAVDSTTTNIFVTGQVGAALHSATYFGGASDIFLMRFNNIGTRAWTIVVGTSGDDIGHGVAVDTGTGDVYVTGYVSASLHAETYAGFTDIVLIKYSGDGARQWTRLAGSSGYDYGYGVAVDSANSAVYVTGVAQGSLNGQAYVSGMDMFLMKYSTDGTVLWTRMAGTTGGDYGYAVAVDTSTGSAYVTGYTDQSLHSETWTGGFDLLLIRYGSDGTRAWTRMVGTTGDDRAYGVAVDSANGGVFMTGFVSANLHGETNAGSFDVFLMKYSTNGTRVWTKLVGSAGDDRGQGLAFHSSTGLVYVTGSASGAIDGQTYVGGTDIVTFRYVGQPPAPPSPTPTVRPTVLPTVLPTRQPTGQPSTQPSGQPSRQPTGQPSEQPSGQPSVQPTGQPSGQPSVQPSCQPSGQPTSQPSRQPSGQPSSQPVGLPTGVPSGQPTRQPSRQPTCQPSSQPSHQPVGGPTGQPSRQPSCQPSASPTAQPTNQPSSGPTVSPTGQPTGQPSSEPTCQPAAKPTGQPSGQPTGRPSGSPTRRPTGQPSGQPTKDDGETVCRFRTYVDVNTGAEFTDRQCFKTYPV